MLAYVNGLTKVNNVWPSDVENKETCEVPQRIGLTYKLAS